MKIAYIGSRGFPGIAAGVEKSLEEVCPRLAQKGHEITLYCSQHVTTPEPVYKGTILQRMPAIPTKHLETISRTVIAAWDALFKEYDIVHFHSIGPALMSWIPKFSSAKTAVTVHGLDWQRAKWGWLGRASLQLGEKSAIYFPDLTVVVSKPLKKHFEENYHKEVTYIPNGVNITKPIPARLIRQKWGLAPSSYILFCSRLVPEKGCHTLIEAYQKIRTDKKLVIAGSEWYSKDYVEDLKMMARNNPNIIFVGWAEGELLRELYSNAALFCLPSQIEGMALALLESMSFGLCPVVSDIPENACVVEENGVLFKNGDASDLAAQLQGLLYRPSRIKTLGLNAKAAIEREYSWDRHADQLEEAYMQLLSGKKNGRLESVHVSQAC